jgi:hypothetical protein
MKRIFQFLALVSLTFSALNAAITVTPSSTRISQADAGLLSLTYQVSGVGTCTLASSSSGTFATTSDQMLGTVSTPVSIPLASGYGSASEAVMVPYAVLKRAQELGAASFVFRRQFTLTCASASAPVTTVVNITQTSNVAADFAIKRIQLYFDNRRAETTVKRNSTLQAYADISFSGNGLLRGYWEVDGRAYPPVIEHLSGMQSVTLTFPEVPPLPTFMPGSHIIRFVVTSPVSGLRNPEIIYYVTDDEEVRIMTILPSTAAGTIIDQADNTLSWSQLNNGSYYFIEMLGESKETIFSAYTKDPFYKIPDFAFRHVFHKGNTYKWRVKGFDTEGKLIGESPISTFELSL